MTYSICTLFIITPILHGLIDSYETSCYIHDAYMYLDSRIRNFDPTIMSFTAFQLVGSICAVSYYLLILAVIEQVFLKFQQSWNKVVNPAVVPDTEDWSLTCCKSCEKGNIFPNHLPQTSFKFTSFLYTSLTGCCYSHPQLDVATLKSYYCLFLAHLSTSMLMSVQWWSKCR